MTQSKQGKDASPETTDLKRKIWVKKLGYWGRVAVMFLSGGFIFPNVLSEGMDTVNNHADKDAKVKKQ